MKYLLTTTLLCLSALSLFGQDDISVIVIDENKKELDLEKGIDSQAYHKDHSITLIVKDPQSPGSVYLVTDVFVTQKDPDLQAVYGHSKGATINLSNYRKLRKNGLLDIKFKYSLRGTDGEFGPKSEGRIAIKIF